MEFLTEYGMFLLKTVTIVAVPVFLIGGAALAILLKAREGTGRRLRIEPMGQRLAQYELQIRAQCEPRKVFKATLAAYKDQEKARAKEGPEAVRAKRVFVLDFQGDIRATAVAALREEITAVLTCATQEDEVVVRLESPGGTVHGYGLGAAELHRLKLRGIPLTVAVDKIAASGGYLMACVADKILAAPFAVIGSIGVIMQLPNFHKLLRENRIDFEQIAAGEYKRTLTVFGENTEKGRAKVREEVEETHRLFKEFVRDFRGEVSIEEVATGEHWYGIAALERKLVDVIQTSDDYLFELSRGGADCLEIHYEERQPLSQRLFGLAAASLRRLGSRLAARLLAPPAP